MVGAAAVVGVLTGGVKRWPGRAGLPLLLELLLEALLELELLLELAPAAGAAMAPDSPLPSWGASSNTSNTWRLRLSSAKGLAITSAQGLDLSGLMDSTTATG